MHDPMTLPASEDAEKAVLGAVLLNRAAMLVVAEELKAEHFYMERHARIYTAMLACHKAHIPPDTRTVSEELRRRGQLDEVGGLHYLSELVDACVLSEHIGYYAADVLKTATRRRLIIAATQLAALAYKESEDIPAILDRAHELIESAGSSLHDPRYRTFTAADLDNEEQEPLLWVVDGLLCAGLTLLVGKPKMRKSWLMLALAIAVASGGRALGAIPVDEGDVLYLALEDGKRRLQSRQRKILQGSRAPRRLHYLTAAPRLDEGCVGVVETWLKRHEGARLVIIDVLAKVRPKSRGGNMYDEDYAALESLQQLAIRRNIAIVVVHHMNRSGAEDIFDLVNGSNGIGGAVDALLGLQYERGQQDATLSLSGREIEDERGLALHWDNATAQWVYLGKAEEVKASQERQEIITLLREEKRPMAPRDVALAMGKEGREYLAVKTLMYRMAKDGDLNSANGRYTIPALTLIGEDEKRNGHSGDRVIGGDRSQITENRINISDTDALNSPSNGYGDRGDRNLMRKNLDHRDHRSPQGQFEAPATDRAGDLSPITADHRTLADLPPARALTLRTYLRGNKESDQERARALCEEHGIDYENARRTVEQGGV